MAEYIALIYGREGCDYSIGCGMRWVYLKSTELVRVQKEVEIQIDRLGSDRVVDVTILEIASHHTFNLQAYLLRIHEKNLMEESKNKEEEERELYEKLKKRYGDK